MFIAEAAKIMLFGYVVIALSVFLFVASVVTVAWSWRLYRRGRKSVAAPLGVIALTLMVGIPSVWAYALIDHRPHRTIQLDFRGLRPDILRDADAYCRPSVSGVSCDSQKHIADVSVRLHDGAVLSLVSSLLSWQVDRGDVVTHISFRSNDNFSLAQAQTMLEENRRLADGSYRVFDRHFVAISKWLVACANGPSGCAYERVCFRARPDLVCATYLAVSGKAFKVEYEIVRDWRGDTGS